MAGILVATSASSNALAESSQRKLFVANGRIWAFYWDPSTYQEYFKSSADNGSTWSSATQVEPSYIEGLYYSRFDVVSDGTYAHIVVSDDYDYNLGGIFYRRALLNSNGTITYSAGWQEIEGLDEEGISNPVIALDSNGYPWVAGADFFDNNYSDGAPVIWKSSTKDGTWSTASGFPYSPESKVDYPNLAPLTSGKMGVFLFSTEANKGVKYIEWSGSAWGSISTIYPTNLVSSLCVQNSVVTRGDDIYCTWNDAYYTTQLNYAFRISGSWNVDEEVYNDGTQNTLTVDLATGDAYCFFDGGGSHPNYLAYKKSLHGYGWSDTNYWIDETTDNGLRVYQSYPTIVNNKIGIFYKTKFSSPYNLKFALLSFNLYLAPSGVSSGEAFGSPKLNLHVIASGIASAEAFGTGKIALIITPIGIATAEGFGTAKLSLNITPSGIPSAEAFGSAKLNLYAIASGIPSAEIFGSPNVAKTQFLQPDSITSEEAFGATTLSLAIVAVGITASESFGSSLLILKVIPSSITSTEALGSPQLNLTLTTSGIPSSEVFGTASLALHILPSSIPSLEAFGLPSTLQVVSPSSILTSEAFGTPRTVTLIIPTGIASEEGFGTPQVIISITIYPNGIASAEIFGVPVVIIPVTLYPDSIVSAEMLGACTLILVSTGKGWVIRSDDIQKSTDEIHVGSGVVFTV
jgi:hypothetical protein